MATSRSVNSIPGMFPTAPARRQPVRWTPASPVKTASLPPNRRTQCSVSSGPASIFTWVNEGLRSATRSRSSGLSRTPRYAAASWMMTGNAVALAIATKCSTRACSPSTVWVGEATTIPSAPSRSKARANSIAVCVASAPAPNRTGTRPATSSTMMTASSSRSAGVSRLTSPASPKQTARGRRRRRRTARSPASRPSRSSHRPRTASGAMGRCPARYARRSSSGSSRRVDRSVQLDSTGGGPYPGTHQMSSLLVCCRAVDPRLER